MNANWQNLSLTSSQRPKPVKCKKKKGSCQHVVAFGSHYSKTEWIAYADYVSNQHSITSLPDDYWLFSYLLHFRTLWSTSICNVYIFLFKLIWSLIEKKGWMTCFSDLVILSNHIYLSIYWTFVKNLVNYQG